MITESATALLIEMVDVLPFGVIELLITKGITVELIKQALNALFHINRSIPWRLIDQGGNTGFQSLQTLSAPGFKQVTATLQTFLTFKQGCGAPQLLKRIREGEFLELPWLQQGRQPRHQATVLQEQLIGEQGRKVEIGQLLTGIVPAADCFKPPDAQIGFLQFRDRGPEQTMGLQGEVLQVPLAELLTDRAAMARAVQKQP